MIEGARFLDLCAGSGAVGIEALSRGAAHVTFVDQSRRMCALIETNIEALGIGEDEVDVVNSEAQTFLHKRVKKQTKPSLTVGLLPRFASFDVVFFDPPYVRDYGVVLNYIGEHAAKLLAEDADVIVEHHKKKELPEEFGELQRYRMLKQGDSCLSFYRRAAA